MVKTCLLFEGISLDKMRGISSPNLALLLLMLISTITLALLGVKALNQETALKQIESQYRQEMTMKAIEIQLAQEIESAFRKVRESIESKNGSRHDLRKLVMSDGAIDLTLIYDEQLNRIFPPDKIQALPREQYLLDQFEAVIEKQIQDISLASESITLSLGYSSDLRLLHCWQSELNYCVLLKQRWLAEELEGALPRIDQSDQLQLSSVSQNHKEKANLEQHGANLTWPLSGIFIDWQLIYQPLNADTQHLQPVYVAILFPLIVLMLGLGAWLFWAQRRSIKENERKTDFLRLVAHEFKTPLANLRLYSDLVRRSESHKETLGYMDVFDAEFFRMRRFLNNAILFEHADLVSKPKLETLDIEPFIHQLINPFEPRLKHSGIDLTIDIQCTAMVTVAREALECSVVNLVDNLTKYAPNQPAQLDFLLQNDSLMITCRDGGDGITAERQTSLFQYDPQKTKSEEGFGLGLVVTKQLIESAGGQISYQNVEHSVFTIQLPIEESQ
ncbi:sensor histidine kinase [Neptuniibacter sp. QD48_11]|uniref:sensor histidine kinase n=1 Tax=unclassified Neptuniibacter TaxID=2630693 RepID=UPI0039F4DEE6